MRARRISRPENPSDQRFIPPQQTPNIWTHIEGKWPRHKVISPVEVASAVRTRFLAQRTSRWRISRISSLAGNLVIR